MADVITRFKLETTQYDSKLRDASKALAGISKQAEMAGKDFEKFANKNVEAARSLGTIASGATNTKDKLKDLVGAYNDVAKAYNNLTEQQRQSDFAKAMAQSLGQLQDRIKETKEELYSLGNASKGGGLFGENGFTGMLQVAGGNLLAKGVSMMASEIADTARQSLELAKAGEGVRLAFERLNRPGLLDNLKEATHGTVSELELMKQAVKFEDFNLNLDEMGTLLAFAQQKAKDTGQSVDYMVDSIVTGLGRKSLMILDNLGLSAAEIKEKMKESGDMTKAVAEIIKEQMSEAGEYVETAADRAARAAADAKNQMEELGRTALPVAEEWSECWNTLKAGAMDLLTTAIGPLTRSLQQLRNLWNSDWENNLVNSPYNTVGKGAPNTGYQGMGNLQKVTAPGGYVVVSDKNGNVLHEGHYDDEAQKQVLFNSWNTTRRGGGGGKGKKTPSVQDYLNSMYSNLGNMNGNAFKGKPDQSFVSVWEEYADGIRNTFDTIGDGMDNLTKWTKDFDPYTEKMREMTEAAKQQQMAFSLAGQAAQNFGAALGSIDDPSAKAAGQVIQAIASIALGFAMASSNSNTAGTGWGWLAWLGAGMSAMATTIATIHSLTGFAGGGQVQGNTFSGDQIPIMANAGEVVLNHAQQRSLASELEGNGGRGGFTASSVSGEQIWIALNAYTKRSGKGEVVTWR